MSTLNHLSRIASILSQTRPLRLVTHDCRRGSGMATNTSVGFRADDGAYPFSTKRSTLQNASYLRSD